MINFANIEKYKENNRIEAKKALGGLPHSIWETYSAFANALGGIILLGVEEHKDKSLHPVDLPDPERLIREFWSIVKTTNKVSANILSDNDVTVENIDGKRIVAIRIPRAQRSDKPVFIDGNALSGSYRRNGEGDYRCTPEEVQAMMRDAQIKTQDMTVLEDMGLDALDQDSVKSYRGRMKLCRPEHVFEKLEDTEFLCKLGAVEKSLDGTPHPTAAGLLMFGHEREIVKKFPDYSLEYQEYSSSNISWTYRMISSSGDWSGNIYEFYFRVYEKIARDINVPVRQEDCDHDDTPVHKALREALANCLINADYYGKQGLLIIKKKDAVTLSNPGGFRIDIEAAKSGGVSDPRNSTLIKMFNLVDVGKRVGSGIPNIFRVWKNQGWSAPVITESFEPDRITLSLPIRKDCDKKSEIKSSENPTKTKSQIQKQAIVTYLTEKITAKASEIAELIGVKNQRAEQLLSEMIADGIIMTDGENESRIYKLKE